MWYYMDCYNGAVYKACNFVCDGESLPEYWYRGADGWAMHKKTLYNKAVKLGLTEAQYAAQFGYRKIRGKKKLRFVYIR